VGEVFSRRRGPRFGIFANSRKQFLAPVGRGPLNSEGLYAAPCLILGGLHVGPSRKGESVAWLGVRSSLPPEVFGGFAVADENERADWCVRRGGRRWPEAEGFLAFCFRYLLARGALAASMRELMM